jgi:hypothetical protein
MDELFDVKHGISIRGKDYGFIGISDPEIDARVDEILSFVESFKGSAGGTFGEEMEACIDFPYEELTLDKFTLFEKQFRAKYPTFDGHLYLHDINHFTADESKILDNMDYADFVEEGVDEDEDEDEDDSEDWKLNG